MPTPLPVAGEQSADDMGAPVTDPATAFYDFSTLLGIVAMLGDLFRKD